MTTSVSLADSVFPRAETTVAVTSAVPRVKTPLSTGTTTLNTCTKPAHVSGTGARPDPLGCETATTASTTVARSPHEASTCTWIERASGP